MAQISTYKREMELDCSAQQIFEAFLGKQHIIPEASPENVQAIQRVKGGCIGSIRKWDMMKGGKSVCAKERMDKVDMENRMIEFTAIEGFLLDHLKSLVCKLHVREQLAATHGCLVSWTFEYEKLNEDSPEPYENFELGLQITKDIAAHLAAASAQA